MDAISIILDNQITPDAWTGIQAELSGYMQDPDALIRALALRVMKGVYGTGDTRRAVLGTYYDRVQQKIKTVYDTAEAVWRGEYGNGEEHRQELIGPDYELVKYRVNETASAHNIIRITEAAIHLKTDQGGRRYVLPNMPTAAGVRNVYGYPQGKQGDAYNIPGSGCGICSAWGVISTKKGYTMTLKEYADRNLAAVGGTKCPISTAIIERLLDREKIRYKRIRSFTTAGITETLREHLQTGNPAILALTRKNRAGVDHSGRYAGSEHYAVLTHLHQDGKRAFLMDSSRDPNRKPRWVDLHDICDHIPTAKAKEDFSPIWNGWSNCGGVVLVYMT